MRRLSSVLNAVLLTGVVTSSAAAQSLFILQGERAVEGSAGWSVGPFSQGVEVQVAGSIDGRWDVGFGFNRYEADFGGDGDTTSTEWSPSIRYFLFKESDDATPVSLAAQAAVFKSHLEGSDAGWYVLAGGQLFKRFDLTETLSVLPYVGFAIAGESYTYGGADAERSMYLTRQFGVHALMPVGPDAWVRITVEEHGFRRETYRAARAAFVRRF